MITPSPPFLRSGHDWLAQVNDLPKLSFPHIDQVSLNGIPFSLLQIKKPNQSTNQYWPCCLPNPKCVKFKAKENQVIKWLWLHGPLKRMGKLMQKNSIHKDIHCVAPYADYTVDTVHVLSHLIRLTAHSGTWFSSSSYSEGHQGNKLRVQATRFKPRQPGIRKTFSPWNSKDFP